VREDQFAIGDELVFLRYERDNVVFARVRDIPTQQPDRPQRLPEYVTDRATFDPSTTIPGLKH
jgi:hypothetical protein